MSDRNKREENLFCEVLCRTDPAARKIFLDRMCAGQPVLRARVEALLAVHAEAERFFAETERATVLQMEDIHQTK